MRLRAFRPLSASSLFSIGVLLCQPTAQALTFNLTFDPSTASAPAGFSTAFSDAIQFYETTFDDPITINLQVGWGEINGQSLIPGALGQSMTNGQFFSNFDPVKSALTSDAKSSSDLTSVAHMAATDPTGGDVFTMSFAEAKALGLKAGDAPGLDGSVGFNNTAAFTFDPNNRAVPNEVDFIGIAEHEISEVMGRYGLGQNFRPSGRYSPIDFFRYSSPGMLDLVPANGAYFSINGGTTVINTFNGTGGGDLSDWAGATPDSYNAFVSGGVKLPVSAGDITEMDVIGYDVLLPGDCNRDGHVDTADIPIMLQALADTTSFKTNNDLADPAFTKLADINNDGVVNNADLQALLDLLKAGGGSTNPVPEPSTFVLTVLAFVLTSRKRFA
jgi:hypothetical protein